MTKKIYVLLIAITLLNYSYGQAPTVPVATAATNITTNTFNATWNASASATSYNLDVATASDFSVFVTGYQNRSINVNSFGGTSFVVNGLVPGTNYYYRVRATNASGSSPSSNVQQVLTLSSSGHLINYTLINYLNSTQVTAPNGVAFDASSNLYVSSGLLSTAVVKVFDKSGTYLRSIGSAGTGPGQFQGPTQLAVDNSGNVFVSDGFAGTVQVFDKTGAYVRTIGGGTIISANELTLAPNGNVYITDGGYTPTQIFVYRPDGTFVTSFTKTNLNAWGLAVDGTNNSYITEYFTKSIQIFNSSNSFVRSIGSGYIGYPHDVKVDANGNIYVADYSTGGLVQIFDNSGTYLYTLDGSTGNKVFNGVSAIAINSNGSVIAVADANNNLVQVFGIPTITVSQNNSTIPPGNTFDFGNVNMLSNSGSIVFTVQNTGTAALNINLANCTLTGANAADFVIDLSALNTAISPGGSSQVKVTFTPSAAGVRTGIISIASNDLSQNPYVINLKGTGIKQNQAITFGALPVKLVGDTPFALTATASSGLQLSYSSSNTSVATMNGNTVTIVGAGATTITASQAGDGNYSAAPDVTQLLTVKQSQVITFGALAAKTFGDVPFTLSATSSSGLSISYASSNTAVATISGNTVTITGVGTTTITASQAGDATFNSAASVAQSLTVNKSNQTITFAALADVTVGDANFNLGATASSGLAVSYASTANKVTINGNAVTIVTAGRETITASQAGNANYNAATPVAQSFCIKPAKPTITETGDNTATPTLTSSAASGNQWFLNGTAISGATNITLSVTAPGAYTVQTKVDDCVSAASNNFAIIVTGDIATSESIGLYPNPTKDFIFVTGIKEWVTESTVTDAVGRSTAIKSEKQGDLFKGDVNSLSGGMYILKIQEGTQVHFIKFIKQ